MLVKGITWWNPTLFEGFYDSNYPGISLGREQTCSKLTITVEDKSNGWNTKCAGDYIVPTANPYIKKEGTYEEISAGIYYNKGGPNGSEGLTSELNSALKLQAHQTLALLSIKN